MNRTSGATVVIRDYGVLAGILDSAVKARRIARNPARGVDNLPRKQSKSRVYLTHDHVDQLASAAGEHRTLVYVLAYCGLRWVKRSGYASNTWTYSAAASLSPRTPYRSTTSSMSAPRSRIKAVACPPRSSSLSSWPASARDVDATTWCSPGRLAGTSAGRATTGWFTRAVEKSGIPRVTPRDLRHTGASLAVSAGVNVKHFSGCLDTRPRQ